MENSTLNSIKIEPQSKSIRSMSRLFHKIRTIYHLPNIKEIQTHSKFTPNLKRIP